MKVTYEVDGSVRAIYGSSAAEGKRAIRSAMSSATTRLKQNWRNQVTGAGLGQRLANTIRSAVYPQSAPSFHPAGLVWSKATNPPLMDVFETGAIIHAVGGRYLAIPLPAAGKGGVEGAKITPAGWEQRTGLELRLVVRPGRNPLLVTEGRLSKPGRAVRSRSKTGRGLTTIPVFVLVPQVKIAKRLGLMAAGEREIAGLPERIIEEWRDDPK